MSYDSNIHHRHSIRLKGYDYSQEGLYYITICVQDRVCMFGNVGAPLVGAQHNYNAQYNNATPKNVNAQNDDGRMDDNGENGLLDINGRMDDDGENGRPRGHAPTCAQYNNDAQNNNDVQNHVNAPNECAPNNNDVIQNDGGANIILGRMYDDGENGRPRGHARTCAQYINGTKINNDVNTPNKCVPNNNDIIQNDGGANNILGRMDDDGQNGRMDDNGLLNDNGRQIGLLDDNGRQIGLLDDNGRPQGHAPTHDTTHDATHDTTHAPTDVPTNAPIMILNDAGKMVETEWLKLTERFRNIELHEYVVMPNHFHGILQIVDRSSSGKTVGDMMDAFKSITTVEYIRGVKQLRWKPFDGKLWQRNYWEHIIRDDQSYQTISDYIIDNPAKWKADKFFNQ